MMINETKNGIGEENLENMKDDIIEDVILDADNEKSEDNETRDQGGESGEDQNNEENTEKQSVNKEAGEPSKEDDEELQTRYLRLAADFQNYKKRAEKERNDIYAYANEKLVTELLNVIDNFERAIAVESKDRGMLEGMKMIFKQFKEVLEKSGLEEIPAEGEQFDPNYHHAVLVESTDSHESGQITEVLQKGYMLNKRVIRASMVKVAD